MICCNTIPLVTKAVEYLNLFKNYWKKETKNIRPGGLLNKTDADAQASLETIAASLERSLIQVPPLFRI